MRRALQRASTFHSSIDPPNGVTTANEILSPLQTDQNNNIIYNQGQLSPTDNVSPKSMDLEISQSPPLSPQASGTNAGKPIIQNKHHIHIKTQRRASTHTAAAGDRDRGKTMMANSPFTSTISAPQLPHDPHSLLNRVKTQIHLSEILPKISTLWTKPFLETPVAGDFHRLAHRITIRDYREGKQEEYSIKEGNPKELSSYLLIHLIQMLEDQSQAEYLKSVIESAKLSDQSEMRYWLESVFKAAGDNSKLVAICKTVSQNIISPVASQIKIIFAVTNGLIKDANSASDGWKIFIQFYDDGVVCSHCRKETSVNSGENSFDFEWKLDLHFSLNLEKMVKVHLELKGLRCNEEMPTEQQQKLVDLLAQMVVE